MKHKLMSAKTDLAPFVIEVNRSYIPGTEIEITVPFTGDSKAFTITTNNLLTRFAPAMRGTVGDDQMLTIFITGTNLEARQGAPENQSHIRQHRQLL